MAEQPPSADLALSTISKEIEAANKAPSMRFTGCGYIAAADLRCSGIPILPNPPEFFLTDNFIHQCLSRQMVWNDQSQEWEKEAISNTLDSGEQTVVTPGTPVQLGDAKIKTVAITAFETNTGVILVGGPNVQKFRLVAGASCAVKISQLSAVWIDSTVGGDKVSFLATQ